MPTIHLSDRALVRVSGPDAEHFLQNIITADISALQADVAKPSALLTPQGKIMFDFLVSRDGGDGYLLDIRADLADDFVRRLMLYRLRAKAEIAKPDQQLVHAAWETDSASSQTDSTAPGLRDARFRGLDVRRVYAPSSVESSGREPWDRLRIAHGVAESGSDYEAGDAFPHDVLLDQNEGVGFRKGCYVGQEVVSRMQHRGTARRRVLLVRGEAPLPASGTELTVDGRSIGALGTVVGAEGLAILRIDKAKEAIDAGTPILAGEVPVAVSIPPGVGFGFPEAAAADAS